MSAANQWVEVPFYSRGSFRQELTRAGIEYTEAKSLFSSVFQIPDRSDYIRVYRHLKKHGFI